MLKEDEVFYFCVVILKSSFKIILNYVTCVIRCNICSLRHAAGDDVFSDDSVAVVIST